jgi:hypothetical protein
LFRNKSLFFLPADEMFSDKNLYCGVSSFYPSLDRLWIKHNKDKPCQIIYKSSFSLKWIWRIFLSTALLHKYLNGNSPQ